LGKLLAYAGMLEGKEVTCFPSYGAEVRGGTANCTVKLSDELVGSPVVSNPDILIVMSDASLNKFLSRLKPDGLLLYDSSLIKNPDLRADVQIVTVPATYISNRIGSTKSANMVMLGAFIAETGILKKASVLDAIESSMREKKKIMDFNRKAFTEGIRYVEDKKSQDI
jgi:2-oxoglutarate ferredoxin oxidoreductase subunit gamma